MVGVSGFVVDDPPCIIAFGERVESCAKDAIDANGAQGACDDAGPGCFAGGIGVRRQDPLAMRILRGFERELECLGRNGSCLSWRRADSANLCDDVGSQACESSAGGGPVMRNAEAGEFFEKRVHARCPLRARAWPPS